MPKKLRVGVLFGGKSSEHEVSLLSAKNIVSALDRNKYDVTLIGIEKDGGWCLQEEANYLLNSENPNLIALNKSADTVSITPANTNNPIALKNDPINKSLGAVDVIFPILHGTYGEDGTIQGLFKLLDIPFVGAGVLGSSVGMDKDIMKKLLRDAGLPIGKFITAYRQNSSYPSYEEASKLLGKVIFVKPANAGSSVGVSKVKDASTYDAAVKEAFKWDKKILLEEFIEGREIECAVLGNFNPIASTPGEIIPTHEFYSYDAKYIDENGANTEIPAKLSSNVIEKVKELAIQTFKALECEGMGRVDVFVTKDDKIFVNEINTIPGFTKISMYPKLWGASGIGYSELLDRLINLALERHEEDKRSCTTLK